MFATEAVFISEQTTEHRFRVVLEISDKFTADPRFYEHGF